MSKRSRINLLASAVIAGGALLLSRAPAMAAGFTPCDDMDRALARAYADCGSAGGTSFSYYGACSSQGYYLETHCFLSQN